MGCGESAKFPFLFQVFIWPREKRAVLRQNHKSTVVEGWNPDLHLGVASSAESSTKDKEVRLLLLKGLKDYKKKIVFFETLESDLITIKFPFIILCCRKWQVLHSYLSKDLAAWCRGALRGSCMLLSHLTQKDALLLPCKYRLVKTHLPRPLLEQTEQRLSLPLTLWLVGLWGCSNRGFWPLLQQWEIGGTTCVSLGRGWFPFIFHHLLDACCNPPSCPLSLRYVRSSSGFFRCLQNQANWALLLCWCWQVPE